MVCSASGLRAVVSVARSSAVSASPRSMRLPMSIIVQPASCTIDSAATPDSASMPASVCCWAAASWVSSATRDPRCELGGEPACSASARSTAPSTIQVSLDIWSRTDRAASPSRSIDCASDPGRIRSTVSDHSVRCAPATVVGIGPGCLGVAAGERPSAPSSTGTHSLPSMSCR